MCIFGVEASARRGRLGRINTKLKDPKVEAFGLTTSQLNILITAYYEDVGWIPQNHHDEHRSVTSMPGIKKLVEDDLAYITSMAREVSAVHSIGDGGFVRFVSSPASIDLAITISENGQKLVEQINLSRRADACIAEGDIHVIRSFIGTLDARALPEFLSHKHKELREEASKQLAVCLASIPVEDLPELLTDSDSVIRNTASGILTHSDRTVRFDAVDLSKGEAEK